VHLSFEEFSNMNNLSIAQKNGLESAFHSANSWYTFFNSVSKSDRCDMFYNWLPTFLNYLINNSFNSDGWIVNIDRMPYVEISNIYDVITTGGKQNRTRKTKRGDFIMTNVKTKHRI